MRFAAHRDMMASAFVLSYILGTTPAFAQSADAPATDATEASTPGDIIVTARKRNETSLSVPVAITAVGSETLERQGITTLDSIARVVPQLMIGEGGGTIQGGNLAIRGISGSDANPIGDQAVAFNIDGVQTARATIRRMGQMDIEQIEVLKGPQTLFYGKNSPGGVISIRTADPTRDLSAKVSAGYEFVADEFRADGYVAGPLTDTLGARLAFFGSTMKGWMHNTAPASSPYAPEDRRLPQKDEITVRGTLKWTLPSFEARFKLGYGSVRDSGPNSTAERVDCPTGTPQFGDADACRADGTLVRGDLGPSFTALNPMFGDGVPFSRQRQWLTSLELNYDPADQIRLTSVTGYYDVNFRSRENFSPTTEATRIVAGVNRLRIQEFSQELRANSDFGGMVDFAAGAYYQHSRIYSFGNSYINALAPLLLSGSELVQKGEAYSVFGQLIFRPIEQIEISGGGRYSHETKKLPVARVGFPLAPASLVADKSTFNDFSPEVTISYRPTRDVNIFAAYKRGFLSGGFNSNISVGTVTDLRYDQQTTEGFEGGIKASLFGNSLRVNLTAYDYDVKGLAVTTSINAVTLTTNAGAVSITGFEGDFNWRTPVKGLSLHGAMAYNDGRYDLFTIACYRGQTQAMGCNQGTPVGGLYPFQNRSGDQLVRAPKWSGGFGGTLDQPLSDGLTLGLSTDVTYSSSYDTDATGNPGGRMPSYALLGASARLSADDGWEVALIANNLTNKYYWTRSTAQVFSGSSSGGVTGTLPDTVATVGRGREVMVRVAYKF